MTLRLYLLESGSWLHPRASFLLPSAPYGGQELIEISIFRPVACEPIPLLYRIHPLLCRQFVKGLGAPELLGGTCGGGRLRWFLDWLNILDTQRLDFVGEGVN